MRFDVLQLLSPSRFVSFCLCFGSLLAFPSLRASSSYLRYECHTEQKMICMLLCRSCYQHLAFYYLAFYYFPLVLSHDLISLLFGVRLYIFVTNMYNFVWDIFMAVHLCVSGGFVRIRMVRVL